MVGGMTVDGRRDVPDETAAGGGAEAATEAVVVRRLGGTETIETPAPAAALEAAGAAAGALEAAMQGIVSITVWVTVDASSVIVVVPGVPEAKTVVVKKEKALEDLCQHAYTMS